MFQSVLFEHFSDDPFRCVLDGEKKGFKRHGGIQSVAEDFHRPTWKWRDIDVSLLTKEKRRRTISLFARFEETLFQPILMRRFNHGETWWLHLNGTLLMIEHQFHRSHSSVEEEEEEKGGENAWVRGESVSCFFFFAFFVSMGIFSRIKYDFRETWQQERTARLTKPQKDWFHGEVYLHVGQSQLSTV